MCQIHTFQNNYDMNITQYILKRLNRWEFFQLTAAALSLMEEKSANMPDSFIEKLSQTHASFEIYDIEIVQERRPDINQLIEAEKECNYAIRTMYKVLHTYKNYKYSPEKQDASNYLLTIFKSYGSGREIARQPQDSKTAIIINLLQELSRNLPKQHIATLNLTDAVQALEMNNSVFLDELDARNKFRANFVPGVAKNARMDAQKDFLELMDLINALAIVEGEEKYAEIKLLLNTLMQKYVEKVQQRMRKKDDESM